MVGGDGGELILSQQKKEEGMPSKGMQEKRTSSGTNLIQDGLKARPEGRGVVSDTRAEELITRASKSDEGEDKLEPVPQLRRGRKGEGPLREERESEQKKETSEI